MKALWDIYRVGEGNVQKITKTPIMAIWTARGIFAKKIINPNQQL